jgi:hypothetical protein
MRCYFLRNGHIFEVEPLPGLTDEQAIEKGHALFEAREDQLDGFEIWDMARVVLRHPPIVELSQLRNGLAGQVEQDDDSPSTAAPTLRARDFQQRPMSQEPRRQSFDGYAPRY